MIGLVISWVCLLLCAIPSATSFVVPKNQPTLSQSAPFHPQAVHPRIATQPLYIFGRNKGDDKPDGADEDESATPNIDDQDQEVGKQRGLPFFSRFSRSKNEENVDVANSSGGDDTTAKASVAATTINPPAATPPPVSTDPAERAKELRAQAERARLEAERMDAQLTLEKIEKLELELEKAKNKGNSVDDMQSQLENLQAKLRGEPPKPVFVPTPTSKSSSTIPTAIADATTTTTSAASTGADTSTTPTANEVNSVISSNDNDLESYFRLSKDELIERLDSSTIQRDLLAGILEIDKGFFAQPTSGEVAERIIMVAKGDFSYSTVGKPSFDVAAVEAEAAKLQDGSSDMIVLDSYVELADGNVTRLAEYVLEFDYYCGLANLKSIFNFEVADNITVLNTPGDWKDLRKTLRKKDSLTEIVENQYPASTRKENGVEPTEQQVQSLMTNVLPKAKFSPSSKPEKIPGGYMIRGNHNYGNGNELIDAIEEELSSGSGRNLGLADKMTILYTPDFSVLARAADLDQDAFIEFTESGEILDEVPPMLVIFGPDIFREPQPFRRSLVTASSVISIWYLANFPFFVNPVMYKRLEDDLSLVDSGITPDLSYLVEASMPLFITFVAIQIIHELGHRLASLIHDTKLSPPTFVPSPITGITSAITNFKSLPKSREEMFDIAMAGPLLGMLASLAALVVGSQLSVADDATYFPALPMEFFRQSTLGGTIIDTIVKGSLYLPPGAPANELLVYLHPVAVAGFAGLFVNALAFLPIGTTDGGRIAMAAFGRGAKVVAGSLFLLALGFAAIFGASDIFLYYALFVSFFQSGNEIPARNEVDEISFPRVVLAIVVYVVAMLSLVPFK